MIDYWHENTGTGKRLTPEEIAAEIYSPSARGVLGIDMERYARDHGFKVQRVTGSMAALRESIDKGVPAIILVDYGFLLYQRNHFMVVKGYAENALLVNSGSEESKIIATGELQKIWEKTGHWMLVVRP